MHFQDLTKQPPRSPRVRIRDYVILARAIDKCRAELARKSGEYHYDCPLDNMLFVFKGISAADLRHKIESGAGDEEIGLWVDENGVDKTPEEIQAWSNGVEAYSLYNNPDAKKRQFFISDCERLGLDPRTATMFDWLEADDQASFQAEPAAS